MGWQVWRAWQRACGMCIALLLPDRVRHHLLVHLPAGSSRHHTSHEAPHQHPLVGYFDPLPDHRFIPDAVTTFLHDNLTRRFIEESLVRTVCAPGCVQVRSGCQHGEQGYRGAVQPTMHAALLPVKEEAGRGTR